MVLLCIDAKEKIYLCDHDDAKKLAKAYGTTGRGTTYLLLKACKAGILSKQGPREAFAVVEIFYRKLEAKLKTSNSRIPS